MATSMFCPRRKNAGRIYTEVTQRQTTNYDITKHSGDLKKPETSRLAFRIQDIRGEMQTTVIRP